MKIGAFVHVGQLNLIKAAPLFYMQSPGETKEEVARNIQELALVLLDKKIKDNVIVTSRFIPGIALQSLFSNKHYKMAKRIAYACYLSEAKRLLEQTE